MLAPVERDALGVGVGDDVLVAGPSGDLRYRVVGVALTPSNAPHTGDDEGAWLTSDGQHRAAPDPERVKFRGLVVGFATGADPDAVVARLDDAGVALDPVAPPDDALMLRGVRHVPLALGAFLGLLAVGAVGHALASAVHRRRRDVVVLRVLGLTRAQARACIAAQATTLALVGLELGLPLGIVIGRARFRSVADETPFVSVPPLALVAVGTDGGQLCLEVADDGAGFDPVRPVATGHGLLNMVDRLGAIDGVLTVEAAPGGGTRVRGRVPLP